MSSKDYISDKNLTFGMNRGFVGVKSPCLGCENRSEGCHSSCVKYVAFSLTQDSKYAKRQDWENKTYAAMRNRDHSIKVAKTKSGMYGYAKTKCGKRRVRENVK